MRDTRSYTPEFFRREIETAELEMTQAVDDRQRVLLFNRIAAARAYLRDLEGAK